MCNAGSHDTRARASVKHVRDLPAVEIGAPNQASLALPVVYDGLALDAGCRIDLLIEDLVVVELKVVETLLPVHTAQLLSYLKLGNKRLGYILNFNVVHMRNGIKRVVNNI